MDNILTIITFLPLVGVALLFVIPRSKELTLKYCTFIFMLADLVISLPLWWKFELANHGTLLLAPIGSST
jgi:NADH:ubiquinone oxidoreductase subunit 4 (subunit M)